MKRRWGLLVIALNLAALIGLVFYYPHLMISPGALIEGHRALATDCFACHTPWRGAASTRCETCHAVADIGLRTTLGAPLPQRGLKISFHQELIESDCMACHSDHLGPRITAADRRPFSHELLRPAVRDRCDACHTAPTDRLHRQITGNCQQCHSNERWKPASFEHEKFFLLDADHDATCETCHTGNNFETYTCYGCHEHTPAGVAAEHREEGIRKFDDCVECHRSAEGEPEGRGGRDGGDD